MIEKFSIGEHSAIVIFLLNSILHYINKLKFYIMKTLKIFFTLLFAIALSATAFSQSNVHNSHGTAKMNQNPVKTSTDSHDHGTMNMNKSESFKVSGMCDLCKARIEKTVKAEGASSAAWNSKTQVLAVTFNPSKSNKESFSKKLASIGHDTEKFKASDGAYAKLPECCRYERSK
jgi:hypothetical protein